LRGHHHVNPEKASQGYSKTLSATPKDIKDINKTGHDLVIAKVDGFAPSLWLSWGGIYSAYGNYGDFGGDPTYHRDRISLL
jgi:hypothetical protein